MLRTSEEQHLHDIIESYVSPLRMEIKELSLKLSINNKKNNHISPIVRNTALCDNMKLVNNMCGSYRHDFGLMAEQDKQALRFECMEWLRAYENNRDYC